MSPALLFKATHNLINMQSNKRQRRSHSGRFESINAARVCESENGTRTSDDSSVEWYEDNGSCDSGDGDSTLLSLQDVENEDVSAATHENPAVASPISVFSEDRCCNCRRTKSADRTAQVGLPDVSLSDCSVQQMFMHRRLKFCCVDFHVLQNRGTAPLCSECNAYLLGPTLRHTGPTVWPAFIWKTLQREAAFESCWSFLPSPWRNWWKPVFPDVARQACDVPSMFDDITGEVRSDLAALESLKWTDLMAREASLALPTVKCPAGCSEWKHKALNHLPLDIVFEHFLGLSVDLYSSPTLRQCSNFFRDDYLTPDLIMANEEWVVKASIIFDATGQPVVLCCRDHSAKNKLSMIHPLRHPTGTVASSTSNQFCPAIVVPRTIRMAKAMKYSANFSITTLEGSYFGLDTMFLSSSGTNSSREHSKLGWKQECLASKARKDIKAHIDKQRANQTITDLTYNRIVEDGDAFFPDWAKTKMEFSLGGSFVKSQDALALHHGIKYDGTESITVQKKEVGTEKTITIVPGWPRCIMWVHPTCNNHGKALPAPPMFSQGNIDTRAPWFASALLLSVPEVWAAACSVTPKRYDRWEGHLLTQLTKECLPHCGGKRSKGNPFDSGKKKGLRLCAELFHLDPTSSFAPSQLVDTFPASLYPTVCVACSGTYSVSPSHNVLVLLNNTEEPRIFPVEGPGPDWELRTIFVSSASRTKSASSWTGNYYYRHGGILHPNWWVQRRHLRQPCNPEKVPEHCTAADIMADELGHWTACVYVKACNTPFCHLRDSLLNTCGGQHKVACRHHRYPLITAPTKCSVQCIQTVAQEQMQCTESAHMLCPEDGCSTALCRLHFDAVPECEGAHHVPCTPEEPSNQLPCSSEQCENLHTKLPFLEEDDENSMDGNVRFTHCGDGDCAVEAEFELNEQEEEDYFMTYDPQFIDNSDSDDDDAMVPTIPTTNSAERPVYTSVETQPYKSCTASNHVILNHFGSCLIRRNADMSGTKTQKSFLQKIIATTPGTSVPLLYPEGMLFTDIFYSDEKDGSTAGAMPVCMLHDASVLRQNGFASLEDHFRTRMKNVGILASSNPKYHFWAFDSLVNLGLRGCDTRAILRRGFTDTQKGGVRFREQQLPIFDTEQVDCRPVVNKLSATCIEQPSTYFYTSTLSMLTHFGFRILYKYIISNELLDKLGCVRHTAKDKAALQKEILESAGALMLRVWMEISHIWLAYIVSSPDKPLGEIDMHFCRAELQDPNAKGNLCHWHCVFWTKDNLTTKEGLHVALDRIRGFISDIVRPDERKQLIKDGIFKDEHDVICFLDTMQTFLQHKHLRRCYAMVKNRDSETEEQKLICKVSNNYRLNPNPTKHSFITIKVEHSQEAIFVFQALGLAERPAIGVKEGEKLFFVPAHPCLVAVKHTPPACGNEGIISPVPGWLVSRNPNSCNIQFTTGYLIMRYLAKYVASIDQYNVIRITPPTKDEAKDTLKVDGKLQLNTKITGNRIHHQRNQPKTSGRFPKGKQARGINISEAYMLHFNYDPILTNIEWIHVPTQPYEDRPARERITPLKKMADAVAAAAELLPQSRSMNLDRMVACHLVRQRLQCVRWRMFTANQVKKAVDDLQSPYTTDFITLFGMRPPELRFVMNPALYAKWFKRVPFAGNLTKQIETCNKNLHPTRLEQSSWIDATTATVRVRKLAVPLVIAHLETCKATCFHHSTTTASSARQSMLILFRLIRTSIAFKNNPHEPLQQLGRRQNRDHQAELETCFKRFVCESDKTRLPTTWFSSVRPTQPNRFLIHLLLSMGNFVEEYSLFNQPTLRHSFVHAHLLDEADVHGSIDKVARSYITQQLAGLPAGTNTFDRYAVAAYSTIRELFLNNEFHTTEIPSVLYCRLTTITEKKISDYIHKRKSTLVDYLLAKLKDPTDGHLPTRDDCMNATLEHPCSWDPVNVPMSPNQPPASHSEQKRLMQVCRNQVSQYKSGALTSTKGVCVVGAGGVGKTTASLMTVLYCICQGLNCAITAINSERAQELASTHLAHLLSMPRGNHLSPGQLAERCISALYRKPERLEYLRTRDVLLFDEYGNASAEMASVFDTVTKYIKDSNRPNGGMLVIGTMDNLQIDPCSGRHPMMSPLFVSNFIFFRLHQCVRSAMDNNWLRLQQITRLSPQKLDDPAIRNEFVNLFAANVGSIPTSAQKHLPPNALFVYGKNEPLKKEQKKLFQKLSSRPNKKFLVSTAEDKERTVEGRMVPATAHTSAMLDKKLKEQHQLYFYVGGRYQITANDANNKYSNSQLAMLFDLPTQEQIDRKQPLRLLLAPPGSRYIPSDQDSLEDLEEMGWFFAMVHSCCDKNVTTISKGIRATRVQYKLRHHIGSTLHSIMGQTLSKLITEVARGDNSPFSLWLASQVVVLLSRTRTAADTVFVTTDLRETAEILYDVLSRTTPFRAYITDLLDKLCAPYETGEPIVVNHFKSIYQCRNTQLPIDKTGSVYLLISLKSPNTTQGLYIGSTKQLPKRLSQHNCGWGARQTSSPLLRPWALLAYVAGFDTDYEKMRAFENEWISKKENVLSRRNAILTVAGTVTLAKDLLRDWQRKEPTFALRLVECGSIQHVEQMRDRRADSHL